MNELVRHLGMALDRRRVEAYRAALQAAVTPGCRVADVGAGSGVLTLLACAAGAGHVHAVEPSPILGHARELVVTNGFADRVTFHRAGAEEVELPGPVDVVVSDLRGNLPLRLPQLRALAAFTDRWLAPGGRAVPHRDVLWVAPCRRDRALHRRDDPDVGVDLSPLRRAATHTWWRDDLAAENLVGEPRPWGEVVFGRPPAALGASLEWPFDAAARVDGLAVWFEAQLLPPDSETGDEIGDEAGDEAGEDDPVREPLVAARFDTAPGHAEGSCYGQAFFPWPERLPVAAGDHLEVELRADPAGDHYTWGWSCRLARGGDTVARHHQSTFHADAPALLAGGGGPG